MNAENFADFLNNETQLYRISYQELKSLVLQYPHCRNLHQLLLAKSQQENHKETAKNLERAATYSIDRTFLYRLVKRREEELEPLENFELNEEYLELKDLNTEPMAEQLEADSQTEQPEDLPPPSSDLFTFSEPDNGADAPSGPSPEGEEAESSVSADDYRLPNPELGLPHPGDASAPPPRPPEKEKTEEPPAKAASQQPIAPFQVPDSVIRNVLSFGSLHPLLVRIAKNQNKRRSADKIDLAASRPPSPGTIKSTTGPKPAPKSTFTSWVQQFQPTHIRGQLGELMESKKREDSKSQRKKGKQKHSAPQTPANRFAEQSLQENNDLMSETLADLLAAQGQYDQAIKMYQRLTLVFPEKSSYFAEQIKKLQNQ